MRKGFTICEMLVVISIIAILSALVFSELQGKPSKRGARVITPEGKIGTVVGREGQERTVRLLVTGPNGAEQYQEVRFMEDELKPAAEK